MQKFFYDNLSATNFDELKIPFIAVAVDIKEHKEYLLDSGPIAPAVVASSSLPPVFTPIEMYKHKLTDGGAIYPVPVEIARRYKPKMVISVDICAPPDKVEPSNMPALAYLAFSLSYTKLCRMQSKEADIDINPDTSGFGLFEDKKGREMYYKGREAALEALPLIKKEMRKRLGK
jgi:NTE family protein